MRHIFLLLPLLTLTNCGPDPAPQKAAPPPQAAAPKPADESRRFPSENRESVTIVDHILDNSTLPPANLASYKKGARSWQQFLVKTPSDQQAAVTVLDFKTALASPKFIAHMGGYFGEAAGKPVFVFSKGKWVAGVIGLPEKEADTLGRQFALRLD